MRLLALTAAALLITGIAAAPSAAVAQPHGWHGGPHHGWNHGGARRWNGRRCTWVWRHRHRVRRCW